MNIGTVIYKAADAPHSPEYNFLCFLTQEAYIVDGKGKKTGGTKTVFLPVHFRGETAGIARDRALAFWQAEIAKEAAKKERGRAIGKSKTRALDMIAGEG